MSGMKKAAVAGALAAGTAVVGFLGASVFAAANFEQAMDGVSASLGGVGTSGGITEAQFASLNEEARRIGSTTSVGATDAARAMDLLAKAGVSVEEIYSGVAQGVVNISEATGESIEQSASSFGTMQNMFRDTGISASQMADTTVNAMNASDMSLSEFQTGIARLAPVISATGMSFQDSSAAIAYFNSQGFSAAEVGTSLTAAFTALVAPTTAQAEAQRAMGIAAFDAQGNFVGFPAIMDQVKAATEGMTEAQTAETIAALFGADARDLMTEATKEGGDPLREYTELMEESGTAARASAIRMDNLKGDFEKLTGAIQEAMLTIGGAFLPTLRNMTQGITGAIEGITKWIASIQQLIGQGFSPLEAILAATQAAFLNLGWETAANLAGELGLIIMDLGEIFGDLVDAGQALINLDINTFFEEMGNVATGVMDALSGVSDALLSGLQAAFDAIPWGTLWDTAVAGLKAVVSAAPIVLDMVLDAVIGLAGQLLGWANNGIDWLLETFGIGGPTKTGQKEMTVGNFLLDAIINLGGKLLQWANNGIEWVLEQFGIGGPTKTGQKEITVGSFLLDAVVDLGGTLKDIASDVVSWVKGKLPIVASAALTVGTFLLDAAVDLGGMLKDVAGDLVGWVKGKFPVIASAALAVGTFLIDAAVDLGGLLKDVASDLYGWVKGKIPIVASALLPVGTFLVDGAVALGARLKGLASNPSAVINTLIGFINIVNVPVSQVLLEVNKIANDMTQAEAEEQIQEDVSAWGVLGGELSELKLTIAAIIPDGLEGALNLLREAVIGQLLVMLAPLAAAWATFKATLEGLDTILIAAAVAFSVIDDAINATVGVVSSFKETVKSAIDAATAVLGSIWSKVSGAWDNLKLAFSTAASGASGVKTAIETMADDVSAKLSGWGDTIGGYLEPVTSFIEAITTAAEDAKAAIDALVPGGSNPIAPGNQESRYNQANTPGGAMPEGGLGVIKLPAVGTGPPPPNFQAIINAANRAATAVHAAFVNMQINVAATITNTATSAGAAFAGVTQALTNQANMARTAVHAAFVNMQIQVAATITNTATSAGAAFAGITAALTNQANMARTAVHAAFVNMQIQVAQTATNTVTSAASAFTPITARLQVIAIATVTAIQATFAPLPSQTSQIATQATQSFISAFTPIQAQATQVAQSTRQSVVSTLQSIVGPAGSSGSAAGNAFVSGFRSISAAAGVASSAVGSIRGILASASAGAFGYGAAVGNQFAAGIRSSLGAVAAAAAALRALMPSSPAKRGPLSKPISFEYVNDALAAAMGGMVRTARRGMYDTQQELNRNAGLAYSGRYGSGSGQNVTIITLEPGRWAEYLRKADRGNTAYSQISSRSRELSLGLRGA
jgi:TP901 family phage tail tape measure protein